MKQPYVRCNRYDVYYFRFLVPARIRALIPDIKREYLRSLRTKDKSQACYRANFLQITQYRYIKWMARLTDQRIIDAQTEIKQFYQTVSKCNINSIIDALEQELLASERAYPDEGLGQIRHKASLLEPMAYIAPKKVDNPELEAMSIKAMSEAFFQWYQIHRIDAQTGQLKVKSATMADYHRLLKEVVKKVGIDTKVSDINSQWMEKAITQLKRNCSEDKFKRLCEKLKQLIVYGNSRELCRIQQIDSFFPPVRAPFKTKRYKRKLLDQRDLSKFLQGALFNPQRRSRKRPNPSYYWYGLVLLYTGARPQEIGQLRLSDVKCDPSTGIYYFELTDTINGVEPKVLVKSFKNVQSLRKIPLHEQLIEKGFLKWLELAKKRGSHLLTPAKRRQYHGIDLLFPGVTYQTQDGWGANCAKWFRNYIREVGIEDPDKVLYSLRHTVIHRLDGVINNKTRLYALVGHEDGLDLKTRRLPYYQHAVSLEVLQESINRLSFDDLDLGHINYVQFEKRFSHHLKRAQLGKPRT